jgi:phosphate:Na+ symporter
LDPVASHAEPLVRRSDGGWYHPIIQSSSVTTVVVVGLVSARAMNLTQSVGVVFGANVGTAITAQIIAFQVTKYALTAVAIGFAIEFFARSELVERIGRSILGLGLGFFGMSVMGLAMEPLTEYQPFLDAMASISNVWVGVLIGAFFTALIQSSSATTAIVITMAATNLITFDLAIALVLGANVGTSVTAQLAAIGKPVEARRVAMVHTLFNVANLFIFIWFTTWFAKAATFLVKDKTAADVPVIETRYLNVDLLATPSIALDRSRMEIARMGTRVRDMVVAGVPAAVSGTETELAAGDIEAIGDAVETNLVSDGRRRLEAGLTILPSSIDVINDIAAEVIAAVDIAVGAVGRGSVEPARRAIDMKPEIAARTNGATEYQLERLTAHEPDRVQAYRIESGIIEDLKRIYYHAKRAARVGVPKEQPTPPSY